ncbi:MULTISPECIES: DUF202 domain-containing protein [Pseudomonas]|uniref:DUF202 domain-containing protein n=1 Tax=Pseudomonas quercus TaxID=2722792 RepID=A0ABX0Y8T9_9PSED|nr:MULTISPECIES: DUF202 domain-containing protein [Pseudomonas]MBF7141194.1 DUF202 domain-containing protein [Pseudomonas sp. LY10J]NJO99729.1 DUF202 domain-containing protein [Pseudomonas quercus]
MNLLSRPHADVGLQPERTWLAWRRTLLSLVGASLLFLRWVPHHGAFAFVLVGVALAAALGIGARQQRRYHQGIAAINSGAPAAPILEVFALALACAVLGLLGLYAVLVL